MRLKSIYFSLIFVSLQIICFPLEASDEEDKLRKVRNEITAKENHLKTQQKEADKLKQKLETHNKEIQSLESELKKITDELKASQKKAKENEKAIEVLRASIKKQKGKLEQQIQLAFKQGQSSSLEMLFANTDAQKNDRIVGYMNYLNREREKTIKEIVLKEEEILAKQEIINKELAVREQLLAVEKSKITSLETVKTEYAKTLKALNKELVQTEDRLIALKDDEINLQYQIDRALKEAKKRAQEQSVTTAAKPVDKPVVKPSGKMLSAGGGLPVKGKIITQYGDSLGGELKSKGMVIQANIGDDVKAIKPGRVLIADYLQGYGQVIVIDHGGDYMSLYGYNSAVLVNVGDEVSAGESIGKVGMMEGDNQSGLYFEIRLAGEAINPSRYL